MRIRDLLRRDLSRKIEEVIQLDQAEPHAVYAEITEYVATDRIKDQYRDLLQAINSARTEPTEGIGVWISGFFGSGKSSFAKNLGYVLSNEEVLGQRVSDLFKARLNDPELGDLIDLVNQTIPTEVVMFDVQKDRAGQSGPDISPFVYRVLLRHLGYAEDFDLAELEIELEAEGRLQEFVERFDRRYAADDERASWTRRGRKGTQVWNRTGVILNEMDPDTYPTSESFAQTLVQNRVQVTPRMLVERSFELMERRRPGKALTFIIDEVGQYVAYNEARLENLRAVVEEFGREGKNRIRARRIPAPAWFVVTSQERLDDVTSAIGDETRVLIAKVRDRFRHEVDLSPADVREVASRRVLSKNEMGETELSQLFERNVGQLNAACSLERTTREAEIDEQRFVEFYPYPPHCIDLSIDIMAGIRLQPGAMRHIGGSNRTIISQVYQMLVNDRTAFADKPVGSLVSLDAIYELIEGQVGSAKQRNISEIVRRFENDPEDRGWVGRVAKAIALLEFVRDLPRTENNIAAVLVDRVGELVPMSEVQAALARLVDAQFIRDTEEGYKLQTAQEKNWQQERGGFQPKPKDRREILREVLDELFSEPSLKRYRYKDLKTFSVAVTVDGVRLGSEGQIPLSIRVAEDADELARKTSEATQESRHREHDLFWVFALNPDIDKLVADYYASGQMVSKYWQLQSQNKISNEEATSLTQERNEQRRLRNSLAGRLSEAIAGGQGIFQGVTRDASDLGRSVPEIFRSFFDLEVPDLYPKLEMGVRKLSSKGKEAEEVLRAESLQGLPAVFYEGEDGLGLVVQEGAKYVPNPSADIAREILDYLQSEHSYGNKITGKLLEARFGGMPYGWDMDVLKLILAVLLRAGSIEITHQSRRLRNYRDPQSRTPLTNNVQFRNSSFAPRETLGRKTLTTAVTQYEQLTGETVDVEVGAISTAFVELAEEEMALLTPLLAEARARGLPVADHLDDYRNDLQKVLNADGEDAVGILAGEGNSFREAREKTRRIRETLVEKNLLILDQARGVISGMWPTLRTRPECEELLGKAEELEGLLLSHEFYDQMAQIARSSQEIAGAYRTLYDQSHENRRIVFSQAVEELQSRPEWASVPQELAVSVLQPLTSRACERPGLPEGETVCPECRATIGQMETDLVALYSVKSDVLARLLELASPDEQDHIEHVRLAAYFDGAVLDSEEAVQAATERLREDLLKILAEGKKIVLE